MLLLICAEESAAGSLPELNSQDGKSDLGTTTTKVTSHHRLLQNPPHSVLLLLPGNEWEGLLTSSDHADQISLVTRARTAATAQGYLD